MKESFLLYKSFYEPIKHLTLEQKGELLDAIFLYQLCDRMPPHESQIYPFFLFFQNQFRLDQNKYDETVEKNRQNALKRWQSKGKRSYATASDRIQPDAMDAKHADNENENENEKVIKYTKKYFKTNWEQILKEIKEEYKDNPEYKNKDFDGVMKEFLMKIDIKNYGYTNYRLAYLNWVRNNYSSGVKPNGAVKSDKSKYGGR